MTTVLWDPAAGRLTAPAAVMEELGEPDELLLAARADGLTIRAVVVDQEAQDGVRLPTRQGAEDLLDADPIRLPLPPAQARLLRLPTGPATYRAWVALDDADEPVIYAVPGQVCPDGDERVTLGVAVHRGDLVLLETLALRHGVRLTDILGAFAEDLAAAYADSVEDRYARSGGGDERQLADDWFLRNVDPTGSWLEGHDGPVFLRGCLDYDTPAGE